MNCARCNKVLTDKMEVEYSYQVNEFYCSPDCATDRYFEYMQSGALDFTNPLPEGVVVINGFLTRAADG